MADISIIGLRTVREVARAGSLTKAAERLGYTQSAVSRQIAQAERACGESLFERYARGVRTTDAGEIVVRHADAVLAEMEATRQDLEDLAARPHGRVRLGAFSSAMSALVPRAIAAFSSRQPRTEVILSEGLSDTLLRQVADGRLDLAIVTGSWETLDRVAVVTLLEDPLLVVVGREHPLAASTSVEADAMRKERWIAGSTRPRSSLLGAWTGSEWEPEIAYVARDWIAKVGLVAAGLGVTVIPGLAVPTLPPSVSVVRIDHPAAVRTTAMATSGAWDRHSLGLAEVFRDASAELAAEVRRHLAT